MVQFGSMLQLVAGILDSGFRLGFFFPVGRVPCLGGRANQIELILTENT